jgi:hypothetical protein
MAEVDPAERGEAAPEPPGIAQAFLEFARPILPAEPSKASSPEGRARLELAQLVWNEEVLLARGEDDGEDGVAKVRRLVQDFPEPVRAAFNSALSLLVERKRKHFAGDLRLIRKIRVRNDRSKGFQEITVQASLPKRSGTAAPREQKPAGFMADLQDYLRSDLPLGLTPRPAILLSFGSAPEAGQPPRSIGRHFTGASVTMRAMKSLLLLLLVGSLALACRTQSSADEARGSAVASAKPEVRYYVIGDA